MNDGLPTTKEPWTLLEVDDFRAIARRLMKRLDMVRASESDYEECEKVFRAIYNRGRSRGVYEVQGGD